MATVTYTPPSTAIIHQVEVDMITRRIITNPIHLVQYDDRLPILEVSLFNGDTVYTCPSNAEVSVRYEKPDNKVVYNPVLGWNSARTKIYVQVSVQMTTAFGEANAILEIKSGGFTAGSANFPVLVERNPVQEGAIISTDEMIQLQAYVQSAANYANRSAESATASASSANTSKTEANRAQSEATKAASSASDSAAARNAAQVSATTASNEATRSKTEATKAETQAGKSKDYSNLSQSYAEGTGNVVRPNDATNNSKFYSELARTLTEEAEKLLDQAQKIVAAATTGALIPSGTIPFEDLPEEPIVGYMYNISNDFTTDDRFSEGPGIFYRAGTNVYWSNDEEWDIMVGVQVTGVKGSKESSYRVGNVNLSSDDIGAVPVAGDISQNIVPFTTAEELSNLETRDSMDVAFGKLAKMYDILDQSAGFYPVSTAEVINKVGTLMDGKTVSDLISKLNGNMGGGLPLSTSILEKALELSKGFYVYSLDGSNYSGNDLPINNYRYGTALIIKRSSNAIVVMLIGPNQDTPITINGRTSDGWTGWQTYSRMSDFGHIETAVTSSANNTVGIPNAPIDTRWIPIVTHHAISNDVMENIFFDNKWYIRSNVTQLTNITFFKQPI